MTQDPVAAPPPVIVPRRRGYRLAAFSSAVLLVFVGYIVVRGPGSKDDAQSTAPPASALTVEVVAPSRQPWPDAIAAAGSVTPWQEASIRAITTGARIVEVAVNVGDAVRRGQVLARYDTALPRAQIEQLRAALRQADANESQARLNDQRARQMEDSGGISRQDLLQFETTNAVAQAQLKVARAQLREREIDLANATVVAPDDGVISSRVASVGAVSTAGEELFRLILRNRLEWRAEVNLDEIGRVKIGQPVRLQLAGGKPVEGQVTRVAPALDATSHLADVFADLRPDPRLRAGMFASGEILAGRSEATVVPASAIVVRDGHTRVAVVVRQGNASHVTLRDVETGRREGGEVEVMRGLTDRDAIVKSGAGLLNEGDVVTVAAPAAPQGAAR